MWPSCLNGLSPKKYQVKEEVTDFLNKVFKKASEAQGKLNNDKILIPVRLVSLLGECTMVEYPDCPNTPEQHGEDLDGYDDDFVTDHLEMLICEWVDFDIISLDNQFLPLRMVFNWGDGDCNDGFWGAVWERNTEELVANILSTGDCETTIEAVSSPYIDKYESQDILVPANDFYDQELRLDDSGSNKHNVVDPFFLFIRYANNFKIEALIGLAIHLSLIAMHN